MRNSDVVRCRMAACREKLDDGKQWSFYLINDNAVSIDTAVLYEVAYEWGDWSNDELTDVRITSLAPGGHIVIWRDDGSGAELRMELSVQVQLGGSTVRLQFEFPKLYRLRNLPLVEGLDKPGWQVAVEKRIAGTLK